MPKISTKILPRGLAGRNHRLAFVLLAAVACATCLPAMAFEVEFPGPVPLPGLGNAISAVPVPWPNTAARYLAVGNDLGHITLVYLLSGEDNFSNFYRYQTSGRVVWLETWENPTGGGTGIVAATVNPDRVLFLKVLQVQPYIDLIFQVDLPEDPGTLAFVGPTFPGGEELAVSLPGIDQVALLRVIDGQWGIAQTLDAGDDPTSLTAMDLEQDGTRELISADQGYLSGSLGIFRRDELGHYQRTAEHDVAGWASLVRSFDVDSDGVKELAVAFSDLAQVQILEGVEGQLTASENAVLNLVPDSIHLAPLPGGDVALFGSTGNRGLVEYQRRQAGDWQTVESYFPGCRPVGITSGDVNGDGIHDLVSLGQGTLPSSVMFGHSQQGFWGFPALTLNAVPGASEMADFDLDGNPDLVVAGLEQPLLSFFHGNDKGGLAPTGVDQTLDYLTGGLSVVEAGGSPGPELALLDYYTGQLRILDYEPQSGFQSLSNRAILPLPSQMQTADLDLDGNEDLFMARSSSSDFLVLFGDGQGGFGDDTAMNVPTGSRNVLAVDLNGDSLLDLAVVDGVSRVYTYLNQGDRTFGSMAWVSAGTGARLLATGDLDGDLDQDVVVANRIEESLTFLENDGSGALVRRIGSHALTGNPLGIICADLNHSGSDEVLVNLGNDGIIGVVFNLGAWVFSPAQPFAGGSEISSFRVGDFNQDGFPDVLNLDGSLNLGLTMLNVDRVMVAVDPQALTFSCDETGLEAVILPDRVGPWDLDLGSGASVLPLVREGLAQLGRLEFDGRYWVLKVSWRELEAAGGVPAGAALRLGVGEQADREYLVLFLEDDCRGQARTFTARLMEWDQEPWPNPFNPSIQSRVHLSEPAFVRAGIHDLSGKLVATLLQENLPEGNHILTWDGMASGRPAAAGVYFLRIEGPGSVLSRKVMLLK